MCHGTLPDDMKSIQPEVVAPLVGFPDWLTSKIDSQPFLLWIGRETWYHAVRLFLTACLSSLAPQEPRFCVWNRPDVVTLNALLIIHLIGIARSIMVVVK